MIDHSENKLITLELNSYPDYWHDLPDNIDNDATITKECYAEIQKAYKVLADNEHMRCISLNFEPVINQGVLDQITNNNNVSYDVSYIHVSKYGCYWYLQGKHSCFDQIEYSISIKE